MFFPVIIENIFLINIMQTNKNIIHYSLLIINLPCLVNLRHFL